MMIINQEFLQTSIFLFIDVRVILRSFKINNKSQKKLCYTITGLVQSIKNIMSIENNE